MVEIKTRATHHQSGRKGNSTSSELRPSLRSGRNLSLLVEFPIFSPWWTQRFSCLRVRKWVFPQQKCSLSVTWEREENSYFLTCGEKIAIFSPARISYFLTAFAGRKHEFSHRKHEKTFPFVTFTKNLIFRLRYTF